MICGIKKRVLISAIITIVALILSNKYWFIFNPMDMSFDIKGKGNCNIEVQLNKKDNNDFDKIKTEDSDVNLDKTSHVDFSVKRSRFPKRMRIIFTGLTQGASIKIGNFKFQNGKYLLKNLDKFEATGAKIIFKDNNVILYPEKSTVILTYSDTLHVSTKIVFEYETFAIILILTYLLAYALSDFVADFYFETKKSRIEIAFLVIFFLSLFIPMLHINNDEISEKENRMLAKWKPLITQNNDINYNFGNDFNCWFNDRFNLRQFFLSTYDLRLFLTKNWITKDVMKGSNNWIFMNDRYANEEYIGSPLFKNDELIKITKYLVDIDTYCNTHNKKFYFFISPDRARIYGEYYNKGIKKISDYAKADQLVDYLHKNSKIRVIYPRKQIMSHKGENLLYWKADTHWNLMGAYWGYSELIKYIQKDFNNIKQYQIKEYTTELQEGDLYKMAPALLRGKDETVYKIPKIDKYNKICKFPKQEVGGEIYCNNGSPNISLVMYRDSFTVSLLPYLSETFGKSRFIWDYGVSTDAIKDADVVILEIVERELPELIKKHLEIDYAI